MFQDLPWQCEEWTHEIRHQSSSNFFFTLKRATKTHCLFPIPSDNILEEEAGLALEIFDQMATKLVAILKTNILQMIAITIADNVNDVTVVRAETSHRRAEPAIQIFTKGTSKHHKKINYFAASIAGFHSG